MFLGDWVVVLCGAVGFLANVAFAYFTWKKGKRYRQACLDACSKTLTHYQQRLSELNNPTYGLCSGCGKIVLGDCPDCAVLSKLVG
jgi:hypothetical protein